MRLNFLTKICLVWGISWGTLSFIIFFLGLAGLWYKQVFWATGLLWLILLAIYLARTKFTLDLIQFVKKLPQIFKQEKLLFIPLILFLIFISLNIIGAFAPEKEFDALWYHLAIPKIYLSDHYVHFIPGNLFYYSAMPRLAEMLYGWSLGFDMTGALAKIIHLSYGIMWAIFNYQILRLFFSRLLSVWLSLACYALLIVSHLSGTAYIDLIVCFYVSGAIWSALGYFKTRRKTYLYLTVIFLGLNLASKLYGAMITLVLGLVLIFKIDWKQQWRDFIAAAVIILAVPMVYFLNAYLATGNPVYPVFSIQDSAFYEWIRGANNYRDWMINIWPTKILYLLWWALVYAFTPVFGLIFLLPITKVKKNPLILPVIVVFFLFFLFWSILPVWEPRYLMVALPLMAIMVGWVITEIKSFWFKIGVIILIAWGLIYNFNLSIKNFQRPLDLAQSKITRSEYLEKYIGNVWYNFYDLNGFFAKNLRPNEKIMTVNFHNLFYAPVGFVDWSIIESQIRSAEDLVRFMRANKMRYIAFNKIEKTPWPNFPKSDLEKYFSIIQEDLEKTYFVIK